MEPARRKRPRREGSDAGSPNPAKRHGPSEPKFVSDGKSASLPSTGRTAAVPGTMCPFMHTINKTALDFDFEKVCSVSLESHNVYACLVCGRYFQGRGPSSHAFVHAIDADHHLFINLQTELTYCLPEGYRVEDPVLTNIAYVMRPKFSSRDVQQLTTSEFKYRTLDKNWHTQGVTALDNLHACDYANVVFTALLSIAPVRDYLLLARHEQSMSIGKGASTPSAHLLAEFSILAKKVWSRSAFRGHVSPHEIMQQVVAASENRFTPLSQSDPVDFFVWLIHTLHREVRSTAKREKAAGEPVCAERANKNLLRDCLQGTLEVVSFHHGRDGDGAANGSAAGEGKSGGGKSASGETQGGVVPAGKETPFWFLSLDLPPKPMFKDASERTLVAQVPLRDLLSKYNGVSKHHVVKTGEQLSYRLKKLPPVLVLTIKRVTKSKFVVEKNPAVVHCPVENLDMSSLCPGDGNSAQMYQLQAVILHDGPHDKGTFSVASVHSSGRTWYNIRNLTVSEVLPQLVALGETCMLFYVRAPSKATQLRDKSLVSDMKE